MNTPKPTRDSLEKTKKLMDKGKALLAYGGLHSVVEDLLEYPGGAFPQFVTHGDGCRIYDTLGQAYVDWFIGFGPMILGHHHPEVDAAMRDQLEKGVNLSLMSPLEVEVAELLVQMIPSAEKAAFGKNGSDATCAAVRLARAHTNREGVLCCGYHGFHDWYQASNPACQGIPSSLRTATASFPYNRLDVLEDLLKQHHKDVAAVILEPTHDIPPAQGFLEGVRELTSGYGVVLIFDEVVTSFRLSPGGAQEYYGVHPDLTCLGKALANGLPLSALVGKTEIMEKLPAVSFGLTFRGEALSLAAAKACLKVYQDEPVAETLARSGEVIRTFFNEKSASLGLGFRLSGIPCRMNFHYGDTGAISAAGMNALFLQECVKRSLVTKGVMLASYALDSEAMKITQDALSGSLEVAAQAMAKGDLKGFLHYPPPPHFYQSHGS